MLTLRRNGPRQDFSLAAAGARPVLLATLDVPFSETASVFAVDSAVESGQPLLLVNAAQIQPTPWSFLGYGYIEREDLQAELRKPAQLAQSLAVRVERLRVCSPHPVDALLELVAERHPAMLVFGPEPSKMRRRAYERAATRVRKRATCLVWTDTGLLPE